MSTGHDAMRGLATGNREGKSLSCRIGVGL